MMDRRLNYGRHHIRKFLQRAKPFNRVLDIGAGQGADLAIATSVAPSATLLAVEVYEPYVERLRQLDIQVHPLDIERDPLPFDDQSINVVIANQVLEHTKDIFWILHEVSRVLTIGGFFIIGVPNLAAFHNRVLLAVGKQPSPIRSASAHVRGFTKGDITSLFQSCFPEGFAVSDWGGSNFYPFPPTFARPLARIFPSLAWGLFMMLEKRRPYSAEFLDFPKMMELETNFFLGRNSKSEEPA